MNPPLHVLWVVNVPMKAVRIRYGLPVTGSGFWLDELAETMLKLRRIDLTIVSLSGKYPHDDSFVADGVKYIQVSQPRLRLVVGTHWFLMRIASIVRELKPDLVNFHGTEYGYPEAARLIAVPALVTLQGIVNDLKDARRPGDELRSHILMWLRGRESHLGLLRAAHNTTSGIMRCRAERRAFRANYYFSGRTRYDESLALRFQPQARKYYITHRILRPAFYDSAWDPRSIANTVLLTYSRFVPGKGLDVALDAVRQLKCRYPTIRLRIGGTDFPRSGWGKQLMDKFERFGVGPHVEFLGYLSEESLVTELRRCSMFLLPSYRENSPNTLAEAMTMGVPVVASRTGGIPSMVEDCVDGVLFEPGNSRALARAVSDLLEAPERAVALAATARRVGLRRHDPMENARLALSSYDDLLSETSTAKAESNRTEIRN